MLEAVSWWHVVRDHKDEKRLARGGAGEEGTYSRRSFLQRPRDEQTDGRLESCKQPSVPGAQACDKGVMNKEDAETEEGLRGLLRGLQTLPCR